MGRKPKPTKLKVLEGNPGQRPLNKREPKPSGNVSLTPPAHLSGGAKAEWRRVAKGLQELGLYTTFDRAALAIYCQSWGTWKEAQDWIKDNGTTYDVRDRDGEVKFVNQAPQVMIAHRSMELCRKMLSEFGFSPSSRSKIQVGKPEDGFEDNSAYGSTLSGRWKKSKPTE